jgi:glucose-6-phosphate 1-dehydrogenase
MNLFIFGGTGDLAKRKLLPALYRHFKAERLSKNIKIYGIGSKELQASEYHEEIEIKLFDNLDSVEYDAAVINEFIKKISYIKIDFNKKNDFANLKKTHQILIEIYIIWLSLPYFIKSLLKI